MALPDLSADPTTATADPGAPQPDSDPEPHPNHRQTQLWLLQPPRTLSPRFNTAFFRSIPSSPGVYLMHGRMPCHAEPRVLYVGKAINLRQRLRSYGAVRPGRASRKTVRLLTLVESILWETCACERSALIREIELIHHHHPPFNRANAWPNGYWFLGLETDSRTNALLLDHEPHPAGDWFGAFKTRLGYNALARCLSTLHEPPHTHHRPSTRWFLPDSPRRFDWSDHPGSSSILGSEWTSLLHAYLSGESDTLLIQLRDRLGARSDLATFDRAWLELDLEALQDFFNRGPRRNATLRRHQQLPSPIIPKEHLDRWLLEHPTVPRESAPSTSSSSRDSDPATS